MLEAQLLVLVASLIEVFLVEQLVLWLRLAVSGWHQFGFGRLILG